MKIRNTKKKTAGIKAAPSKKTPAKGSASGAPAKKKVRPAEKTSAKSQEKGEKPSVLKKTAKKPVKTKKDLPAGSPKVAKKTTAKKSLKPAQVKATKSKKKITKPKSLSKKGEQKTSKGALTKAPSTSKKISPVKKQKVIKEIRKAETAITKKTKGPVIKLSPNMKMERVKKPEKGPEEKKALIPKREEVFREVLEHVTTAELPEEYGENELILIAVDPNMVFVDWEVGKEEASRATDGFTMRIFDVTGVESPGLEREHFVDIKIKDRIGRAFFELGMPGRKVAVEIGYYENGKFLPVMHASAVSMPRLLTIDELGIAQKLFESGIPVGY